MDKNSLILEIKNDLNSIKKQVEVTLAKLTVLESMIELDKKLGVSVAEPVEAPVAEAQVLRNLMSVISLGDKFRFRHDLFSDSNDLFKETIEILNTIEKFDEAVNYLQGKFKWDAEDATVVYFYDIIRPKF
jgi:hypothetical protein